MLKSRTLWALLLLAGFFVACKSDPAYDRATQAAIDDDLIRAFLSSSNIDAKKTSDGLYYQIIADLDTGKQVSAVTDTVDIHYVSRFLDGVVYDSTASNIDTLATKFVLNTAIEGWVKGIPLIKTGGVIRLIVPSTMAYQNRLIPRTGVDTLPPNTIFDFNIRLIRTAKYNKDTNIN